MSKKLTTEDFLIKARAVHGDKYDYSKVVYVGIYDFIIIICKIHGEFKQIAKDHLKGSGCQKCANIKVPNIKLTTEEFICRAKEIYNNRFDLSKVNYVNSQTKVVVTCLIHGDFLTKPMDFLNGHSCAGCKSDKIKEYFSEKRKLQYLPYMEASTYCIENNIKSGKQYYKYYKANKPDFLPAEPSKMYVEWINWQTFLNTNNVRTSEMHLKWLPFNEAKSFVQKLKLSGQQDYFNWWNKNKPDFLPKSPHIYYRK